jgi:hypothetical protein
MGAAVLLAGQAVAQDIRVTIDSAAPLRLSAPAQGIAVGNGSIIGVSVQNDRLLFVTGRAYGSTNLVIVAADGRVIYSGRVTVLPDETDAVMFTRGSATQRLECTPLCRPRPDIGDGADSFGRANEQASARQGAASQR